MTRRASHVVVDASVMVKWLAWERDSHIAYALLDYWTAERVQIAAPYFMAAEVTNALHRKVVRGESSVAEAQTLLRQLNSYGIQLWESANLHERALELGNLLREGAAYDVHYLALAEALGCSLWTADERFYRAANAAIGHVRATVQS